MQYYKSLGKLNETANEKHLLFTSVAIMFCERLKGIRDKDRDAFTVLNRQHFFHHCLYFK